MQDNQQQSGNKTVFTADEPFFYLLCHHLRSPACTIESTLQIIKERLPEDESGATDRLMAHAFAANQRQFLLIDRLAAWSEIVNQPLQLVDCDLNEVFNTVASQCGIKPTSLKIESTLPDITADPKQLGLAFQQLIENSHRYCDDGVESEISVRCGESGSHWELHITDNAIAVPVEERERVFAPLVRLATAKQQPGAGMGLTIARCLIEKHGGELRFTELASCSDIETASGNCLAIKLRKE